jgi:omega-amidase
MNVLLVQLDLTWEDPEANYQAARRLLARRTDLEGSLIVLPEMFATGFSMNVEAVVAGEPSRTESVIAELAMTHRATVVGGLGQRSTNGKGANLAIVVDPEGRRIAEYSKIHPFTYGGEDDHYDRGDAITTFDWAGIKVCPFVCYDLRFPEVFRAGVAQGAELFCVIANWPIRRAMHWVTLLQARAIENLAYVVGVNRCGTDPSFTYPGRSLVADPHGIIIADAADRETVVSCEVDATVVREWRQAFPALDDIHFTA